MTLKIDSNAKTTEKLFIPKTQEELWKQTVITLF